MTAVEPRRAAAPASAGLPPGPDVPDLVQTFAFHRDPLGVLERCRARYGPVFTLRLAVAGPTVVVADPDAVEPLISADPSTAGAGNARRKVLPFASDRSTFGADGAQHQRARARVAGGFGAATVAEQRPAMARLAAEHAARWPRNRPFRLLPRVRTLIDEIFVRHILGVPEDPAATGLVLALRRMLLSPGNPPLPLPGPGNGTLERPVEALFAWRSAPLRKLLGDAIDARRGRPATGVLGSLLEHGAELSTDEMVDELLAVLMAAQEPPSVAVTWLLDRVARDPQLEGADDAVVRETLRLRPPALGILRTLTEPMQAGDRTIPAGAVTMLAIPLLHRDPAAFPDPDAFRPDRWLHGDASEAQFIPFGGGARRCIGAALAQSYFAAVVPAVAAAVRLRPLSREPERMVVRATTLVPQRSELVLARG
jgi:cytochrome P450